MDPIFFDRREGGRRLAEKLRGYYNDPHSVVLALPRGGVPVAYEVARRLAVPLDVFLVRKLGLPGHEEFAMGAIASGGVRVLNEDLVQKMRISDKAIAAVALAEEKELIRREWVYRGNLPHVPIAGETVFLVDDGLATGSTMRAAILAVRKMSPRRIIVGVPIGPPDTCDAFREEAEEVVCAHVQEPFYAVSFWYREFSQVTDEEVRQLLIDSRRFASAA